MTDPAPPAQTVGAALARTAEVAPDQRALVWLTDDGSAEMTWSEVERRSSAIAAELAVANPRGARVAIAAVNSIDWLLAMYGCALAGLPIVPISPWAGHDEAAHVLGQAAVRMILVDEMIGDHPVGANLRRLAAELPDRPVVRGIASWPEVSANPPPRGAALPDDEFVVQPTSGTTGLPKLASLSHRAVTACADLHVDAVGASAGDTWFNPLPLHHVGGLVAGALGALAMAGGYVVTDRFSAADAIRMVREIQPQSLGLVPTMLIDLLAQPGVGDADFTSVRTVVGGATNVDPALIEDVEARLGIRFLVGYGQSEAPCLAVSSATDPTSIRTRTLGHPLAGRDYCITAADGSVLPVGEVGELRVRGPLTMTGYLQPDGSVDPDTDAAGWRRTGDLCAMAADGVLTFHGRTRDLIIRGGTNVYPAEVEFVMAAHPAVADVAVFGVPDARLGERVVAAIIPHVGADFDVEALNDYARERLSGQKRPSQWIIVSEFPRTGTGKVRKHLLRRAYDTTAPTS